MEKQRNTSKSKSCRRLLISLLLTVFFSAAISAQTLTNSQIKQLRIEPAENQKLYSKTEIRFQVILPGISASSVQIQNPSELNGVTFKTLRKTETFSDKTDTKIELWFIFDKKGTYELPALSILLYDSIKSIKFSEVTIEDDPINMPARMMIKFKNGHTVYSDDDVFKKILFNADVGEKVSYTIYLQHAVQLIQFNWNLPKDSILTETESFEITKIKYREKSFTDELIPVASFEWVSLTEGNQSMPSIQLTATGYNGYRSVIKMPEFYINFTKTDLDDKNETDVFFAEAFNPNFIQTQKADRTEISDEACEKLAKLRTAEKNAFLNMPQARRDRKTFEESCDLPSNQTEYPVFVLHISILVLIILLGMFISYLKHRKMLARILTIVVIICDMVILVSSSVQVSKEYAIAKHTIILSVPDESATASNELSAGTRVRILEETDEWNYIEFGEIGGWVKKDRLCKI